MSDFTPTLSFHGAAFTLGRNKPRDASSLSAKIGLMALIYERESHIIPEIRPPSTQYLELSQFEAFEHVEVSKMKKNSEQCML